MSPNNSIARAPNASSVVPSNAGSAGATTSTQTLARASGPPPKTAFCWNTSWKSGRSGRQLPSASARGRSMPLKTGLRVSSRSIGRTIRRNPRRARAPIARAKSSSSYSKASSTRSLSLRCPWRNKIRLNAKSKGLPVPRQRRHRLLQNPKQNHSHYPSPSRKLRRKNCRSRLPSARSSSRNSVR